MIYKNYKQVVIIISNSSHLGLAILLTENGIFEDRHSKSTRKNNAETAEMPVFEILAVYIFNIYMMLLAKSQKRGQKVVCQKTDLTNIFSLFSFSKLK